MNIQNNEEPENQYPDLTTEEIKACEVFKDLNEEQAHEVSKVIKTYTELIYALFVRYQSAEDSKVIQRHPSVAVTDKAA